MQKWKKEKMKVKTETLKHHPDKTNFFLEEKKKKCVTVVTQLLLVNL